MRLIDGDALEKFLSDAEMEATKRKKYVFAGALNVIQGNVRNFPTIEPDPQWIPCAERLPEEYSYVLCCDTHGEFIIGRPYAEEEANNGFSAEGDNDYLVDCVAWQPLPEPYKGEGGEE